MRSSVEELKQDLLLLVHRIPFPPNKGDKIRSYHLLKHLAKQYTVHLGTFIDDQHDLQYVETVKKWCGDSHFAILHPVTAKLGSITALLANRPLSIDYYRNSIFQNWVNAVIQKHNIEKIVIFSSAMAQFVEMVPQRRCVIDFVDVDSDKWTQYSHKKIWPMSWLYRREGKALLQYERKLASICDASLFVSEAEANLFKQLAPDSANKIDFFNNGVDTEYFSPDIAYENPYMKNDRVVVFTGAMDYWPNIDAVTWFVEEVFPKLQKRHPDVLFYIVGARPTDQVQQLANLTGVHVTGSVPDVRPYLAHARVAIAPLRIARGIQNKVLEAMAMAKTVVVSVQALEGIDAVFGEELLVAKDEFEFVTTLTTILIKNNETIGVAARKKVQSRYNWDSNLCKLDALLDLSSI